MSVKSVCSHPSLSITSRVCRATGSGVERSQVRLLPRVAQVRRPPALVDRRPDHDRRMVVVALHRLDPLAREAVHVVVRRTAYAFAISPETRNPILSAQ